MLALGGQGGSGCEESEKVRRGDRSRGVAGSGPRHSKSVDGVDGE